MINKIANLVRATCLTLASGLLLAPASWAQTVFSEDFGTGTYPGAALAPGTTTYGYATPSGGSFLLDGEYTIGTNTEQGKADWASAFDHSTGDGTGFMMIVNATEGVADEFYRTTVNLSPSENFSFSAWVINANSQADEDFCNGIGGGHIKPNVTLSIQTLGGTVLASQSSGDIPVSTPAEWLNYTLDFTTDASTSQVQLVLQNNAPGGCGNDLAIDDIEFFVRPTVVANDDSANPTNTPTGVADVVNVTTNDTDDGAPIGAFDLAIASGSSLPPELTFNTSTGSVGVVAGADTGVYAFDYEICASGSSSNCDTATTTITVFNPGGGLPPVLSCPAASSTLNWDAVNWSGGSLNNTYTVDGTPIQLQFSGNTADLDDVFLSVATDSPYLNSNESGGLSPAQDSLSITIDHDNNSQFLDLDISLGDAGAGVAGTQFTIFDVDSPNNSYIDQVTVTAFLNGVALSEVYLTPGSANTASGNSVYGTAQSANSANANVVVTVLEQVDQVVVRYENAPGTQSNPSEQMIAYHDIDFCQLPVDYSDAPSSYGAPSHGIDASLYMGSVVPDADSAANPGASANGDDVTGTDDEDGASIPALTQRDSANILVNVRQASVNDGYLQGWIDWNGDGDFNDGGEQIATDLQLGSGTNGNITIPIDVPATATTSQTYARFRWSTTSGLNAITAAPDGEVEDHALTITEYVPTPAPVGTQSCSALTGSWNGSGLNWSSTTSSGLGVTAAFTVEPGGSFTGGQDNLNTITAFSEPSALGAPSLNMTFTWDTTSDGAEDASVDGVPGTLTFAFDRPVVNPVIHVDRVGGSQGTDPNSGYFELTTPGASITRLNGVPHFTTNTDSFYRELGGITANSQSSLLGTDGTAAGSIMISGKHSSLAFEITGYGPDGAGADGFEMVICGHAADFGDAPATYGTLNADNGASHQFTGAAATHFMGAGVNADSDGQVASGNATNDSDDGVALPALKQNVASTITTTVVGAGGYLQAWIDWNGDGDFDVGEEIATDIQDGEAGDADGAANGQIAISVTPPQSSVTTQTFARFRWSTESGLGATGFAVDGEVEDYALTISGAVTHECGTGSSATGSGYASSGTGAYRDSIWWLDWSCAGATFNAGDIVNRSWSLPGGITVTAQITDITQSIFPYNTGDWQFDELPNLYGGLNPIGLANAVTEEDPNFSISWSASRGGTPIPVDLIFADAEDLGGTEITQGTTDGGGWEPIEFSGEVYAAFTLDGARIIESEPPNAGSGTLLVMSEGVSNLDIDLISEGRTAVALGFMLPMDIGDAPATYATGGHYARHTAVSSTIQPAAVTLADNLTYSTLTPAATSYMGVERPDSDPTSLATSDSTGDDANGIDDEDGVTMPIIAPGASLSFPVTVEGAGGYLQAWADWNGDGDFEDAGEQIAVDAQDGVTGVSGRTDDSDAVAGTITINATVPGTLVANQTSHIRFRWSSQQGLGLTDIAFDGEMEDYSFIVTALNAELAGSKTIAVFDPTGSGEVYALPGEDVIYTLTIANTGDGPADTDTVILIDRMPEEVEFFNGDVDSGGPNTYPGSDPVGFVDNGSGLTFTYSTDVRFSDQAQRPADFAACTYTPQAGYDAAVTYICFNPKGQMAAGDPDPDFSVSFRARIK